jgi:hypothetical protein
MKRVDKNDSVIMVVAVKCECQVRFDCRDGPRRVELRR